MIEHDEIDEFVVQIGPRNGDVHPVTVLRSPAGTGGNGKFAARDYRHAAPSTDGNSRQIREDTADANGRLLTPVEIGRDLFRELIAGEVAALFERSLGISSARGRRLRIRLHLNVADPTVAPLAALPWETLFRQENRSYLTLSPDTTFVRSLDVPISLYEVRDSGKAVRVLFVMSNPKGDLNLAAERAAIEQQLAEETTGMRTEESGTVFEAQFLENATFSALESLLYREDYQIIHFMGHGDFDASGEGKLLFHDGLRSGRDLGELLKGEPKTRLVTLNACDTAGTAERDGADPFAGVATALVMAGVPAVIAMQFPVSDGAAVAFAARLYADIGRGRSIEAAVDSGRRRVKAMRPDQHEWATPVLFLRDPMLSRSPSPSRDHTRVQRAMTPTGDVIVPKLEPVAPPKVVAAPAPAAAERTVAVTETTRAGGSGKGLKIGGAVLVAVVGIAWADRLFTPRAMETAPDAYSTAVADFPVVAADDSRKNFDDIAYEALGITATVDTMWARNDWVRPDGSTSIEASIYDSIPISIRLTARRTTACTGESCAVRFRLVQTGKEFEYPAACFTTPMLADDTVSTEVVSTYLAVPDATGRYRVRLMALPGTSCTDGTGVEPSNDRLLTITSSPLPEK